MGTNKKPIISIVVATYNRSDLLRGCLESFTKQTTDFKDFEVIIIDNNSQDDTKEVSQIFTDKYPNFRYFLETKQGASAARNRGSKEAQGKYIGYLDDDAKAHNQWINEAIRISKEIKPDIFGGPIYPFYLEPKEDWFKDEYEIRKKAESEGFLENGIYFSGSNLVFNKEIFLELGGYNIKLGPQGNLKAYNEDTDIQRRARRLGKNFYYSPKLKVYHLVPKIKQNILHQIYTDYKVGKDALAMTKKEYSFSEICNLLRLLDRSLNEFQVASELKNQKKYKYPENYIKEKVSKNFSKIGQKVEYFLNKNNLTLHEYFEYKRSVFGQRSIGFIELVKNIITLLSNWTLLYYFKNLIKKIFK